MVPPTHRDGRLLSLTTFPEQGVQLEQPRLSALTDSRTTRVTYRLPVHSGRSSLEYDNRYIPQQGRGICRVQRVIELVSVPNLSWMESQSDFEQVVDNLR
jgi:hypothetical protein